jgi:hypothetical protein
MSVQMGIVLVTWALAGNARRVLRSIAVLVAASLAGLGLSALEGFGPDWPFYFVFFLVPIVVGVVAAPFQNRSRRLELYRHGSRSRFLLRDGLLLVSLNSHKFGSPLSDLVRIGRIGGSAVLIFNDRKILLVPREVLPRSR